MKKKKKPSAKDSFEIVAKRLGCDEDKAAFEQKRGRIAKTKPAQRKARQMIWDVAAGIVIGGSVWALVLFGYALLGTRECTSRRRVVSRDHWG